MSVRNARRNPSLKFYVRRVFQWQKLAARHYSPAVRLTFIFASNGRAVLVMAKSRSRENGWRDIVFGSSTKVAVVLLAVIIELNEADGLRMRQ